VFSPGRHRGPIPAGCPQGRGRAGSGSPRKAQRMRATARTARAESSPEAANPTAARTHQLPRAAMTPPTESYRGPSAVLAVMTRHADYELPSVGSSVLAARCRMTHSAWTSVASEVTSPGPATKMTASATDSTENAAYSTFHRVTARSWRLPEAPPSLAGRGALSESERRQGSDPEHEDVILPDAVTETKPVTLRRREMRTVL
jgi:hypothetical protein